MSLSKTQPSTHNNVDKEPILIHAVVFDTFESYENQNRKKTAKELIIKQANELTVGQSGESIVYGNAKGHGVLDTLEEHGESLERQRQILADHKQQLADYKQYLADHQRELTFLNSRVETLLQFSQGYMDIRRRFFDVYRRDIKQLDGYHQTQAIRSGNSAAHDGDAVGDAFLFVCDKRTDRTLYRELYGLDADQVLRFHESKNDKRLPAVLNAHANLVIRGRALSPDIKEAFQQFLITVEESMEGKTNNPLDTAYFKFWQHYPKDFQ